MKHIKKFNEDTSENLIETDINGILVELPVKNKKVNYEISRRIYII